MAREAANIHRKAAQQLCGKEQVFNIMLKMFHRGPQYLAYLENLLSGRQANTTVAPYSEIVLEFV